MIALSVRQPWAWLLVNGFKDIENRTWPTKNRGKFLIHASKGMTRDEYDDVVIFIQDAGLNIQLPEYHALTRGALVGVAELVGCVRQSGSVWFNPGCYGFQIANARAFETPVPYRGMLSFFNVDMPTNMERNLGLYQYVSKTNPRVEIPD